MEILFNKLVQKPVRKPQSTATTDKIHRVQSAIYVRQSNRIFVFRVFYSEKLPFRSVLINQLLQMSVSEAIELRLIVSK